ncbi:hypothetical protein PPTG_23756 [Phytophthora nicotianae INRA-310]|uniref:Uncharacterized protein n=1 Tax=Phytophthora nicotianae (strain INRA-310) TaxID=761204 RepID=W2PRH7_PHYN3|nr:hypothetical protein PPTG_23756 [Phytophthora nicotianae INRA-310]ETN03578.1 hypothetical protein PPTG_23756 [Phytophthora nicotianae INRA-310]
MVKVQSVQEEIDDIDDCHGCIEDSDEFLTKTRIEICCLFPHNGAFDRVRRRLAVFNSK